MCIIVYKPKGTPAPDTELLKRCWDANPDGAGMMWTDGDAVHIEKGFMNWEEFEAAYKRLLDICDIDSLPLGLHFRIATHGDVKPGCCHPFPIAGSAAHMRKTSQTADIGFMHNGMLRGLVTSSAVSDSMAYAKTVINPLTALTRNLLASKSALQVIDNTRQDCRFLLMDSCGNVETLGRWIAEDGILFSNTSYRKSTYSGYWEFPEATQTTLFDDAFFSPSDYSIPDYGQDSICESCECLTDCKEEGFICFESYEPTETQIPA